MPYADSEKRKQNAIEYYLKNKESLIAKSTEGHKLRMKNPEYAEARKERIRKRHHERKADPEYTAMKKKSAIKTMLKTQYGITEEQYWDMHKEQNGECKICGASPSAGVSKSERNLIIDHCHTTNKIRGLLCNQCNIMLGMSKDNRQTLMKAIEYLGEG